MQMHVDDIIKCMGKVQNAILSCSKAQVSLHEQTPHVKALQERKREQVTGGRSQQGVRIVLVGFQGAEDVSGGMKGTRPDDAQAGEVQRQQH